MMKTYCHLSLAMCCLAVGAPMAARADVVPGAAVPGTAARAAGTASPDPVTSEQKAREPMPPGEIVPSELDLSADPAADSHTDDAAGRNARGLVVKNSRFTLAQEDSLKTRGDHPVVNNRGWFRVEYSRFFWESFFVQLDTKVNGFWATDHRAKAENRRALFETNTQEAFLQYSAPGGHASFRAGIQRLIWGESEAGAITDEVSPRNFSELFFIPLEESRIGQFMLNADYFSGQSNTSLFFIPEPKFNKYPKPGTAYYIDPFNGLANYRDQQSGKQYEYGVRWKKTIGKSDISFLAASLIDNDLVLRLDGVPVDGHYPIARLRQRFTLAGMTFNYSQGNFLLKGELGLKSPKSFNDAAFGVIKKDVLASSLGLTWSLGQSSTVGAELVNTHVRNWDGRIVGVPRDSNSLVLNTNLSFLNDTLNVNWLMIYNQPYTSYQSSVRTSYKWRDNTTLSLDFHAIAVPDKNSPLRSYRDQGQIVFRVQHQF